MNTNLNKPSLFQGDNLGLLGEGRGPGCGLIRARGRGLGLDVQVELGLELAELVLDDALVVTAVFSVRRLEEEQYTIS